MPIETIQLRRDLAANWASINPVLAQGEAGVETDTGKAKLGNGAAAWNSLPYWNPSGSGGGGTVSSVFGRTGTVAAAGGDYAVSQVTGAAPLASPALTGTPTAPTASALTGSTQVATTAYADSAVAAETSRAETAEALLAPLASPALTGSPTAPTQVTGDDSTKIATTAYVDKHAGITDWLNVVTQYGAKADIRDLTAVAITASANVLTCSAGNFTSADAGKAAYVYGAGAAGGPLITTISSVTNSTTVTLTANASTTVSSGNAFVGTDDTAAWASALAAVQPNGQVVYLPWGRSYVSSTLSVSVSGTVIAGGGWGSQIRFSGSVVSPCIKAASNITVFVRDIRISQVDAAPGGTAIDASGFTKGAMERLLIGSGGGSGQPPLIAIDHNGANCHYNAVRDCYLNYSGTGSMGIAYRGASHSNTLDNCRIIQGSGADSTSSGVYVGNCHSTTLIHPDIEGSPGNGVYLDTGANGTTLLNPYLEGNNINLKISSGVMCPVVLGGTIQSGTTANIQDNGAVQPVYASAWENSGTAVLGNIARVAPTAVKTSGYTAAPGDFVPVSTSGGPVTVTLPAAPQDQALVGVKMVVLSGSNTVTIAAGGSDVFNVVAGSTSLTLARLFQTVIVQYNAAAAIWYVLNTDPVPVTSVTAADTSVVIGGTASAPTVRTATLDVIAADHPAAADWSNNSHKITSVANGSGAQDAAAFGQVPVAEGTAGNIKPVGTAAATGSSGKWPNSDHVHSWGQAAPAGFTPANPAATTSTTLVMMGLGTTCTYTPAGSGLVLVVVSGYAGTATAVQTCTAGFRYGTGTAPANGAAVTGTRFGAVADPQLKAPFSGVFTAFSATALLTLTAGTTYWFDIALNTANASDAASMQDIGMTMAELP